MIARAAILCVQWAVYAVLSFTLQDRYRYQGIEFAAPDLVAALLSLGIILVVAAMLPSEFRRPRDGALWLLASFVVVPTAAVAAVNPTVSADVGWRASVAALLGFLIAAAGSKPGSRDRKLAPVFPTSEGLFVAVVVVGSLVAMATIVLGYGVSSFDLSFSDTYERRLTARATPSPYPGATYLVAAYRAVLVPLAFVIAVVWRRPAMAVIGLVGVLMIFSFTGEKSIILTPVVAMVLVFSRHRSVLGSRGPWLGGLLTAGFLIAPMLIARAWPPAILDVFVTRRIGLVPGLLTNRYVEFVGSEGFTWFSQSWLRWLGWGADARPLGLRVGEWIDPGGTLNANANLWADGYASAGFLGVAVVGGLLAVTLRLLDLISLSRDPAVASATLGVVCFTFVNGYFHTALLTGGVLFAGLLLWIFLPQAQEAGDEKPGTSRDPFRRPVTQAPFSAGRSHQQSELGRVRAGWVGDEKGLRAPH